MVGSVLVYCGLRYALLCLEGACDVRLGRRHARVLDLDVSCEERSIVGVTDRRTQRRCILPFPDATLPRVSWEAGYLDRAARCAMYVVCDVRDDAVPLGVLASARDARRYVRPRPGRLRARRDAAYFSRLTASLGGRGEHPGALLYEWSMERERVSLSALLRRPALERERAREHLDLARAEEVLLPVQYASLAGIVAARAHEDDARVLFARARRIVKEYGMLACSWWR